MLCTASKHFLESRLHLEVLGWTKAWHERRVYHRNDTKKQTPTYSDEVLVIKCDKRSVFHSPPKRSQNKSASSVSGSTAGTAAFLLAAVFMAASKQSRATLLPASEKMKWINNEILCSSRWISQSAKKTKGWWFVMFVSRHCRATQRHALLGAAAQRAARGLGAASGSAPPAITI